MRTAIVISVVLVAIAAGAHAGIDQPIYIIDSPTAGLLQHGEINVQGRLGPGSAFTAAFRLGIKGVVHAGISFGMQNIFERGAITVNDQVGVELRVRIVQEGRGPAFALGFNSQGTGPYDEEIERYERKSKGFYGALSKNWKVILGHLSMHGGANYSTERMDQDTLNIFAALDWEVVHGLSFLADWDAGFNDNIKDGTYGGGDTYLDAAVRVNYGTHLSMMLIFRDLLKNYEPDPRVWREFEIAFFDTF